MDSLKNLFAFGNDIDNLYTVTKNYPFTLDAKGVEGRMQARSKYGAKKAKAKK